MNTVYTSADTFRSGFNIRRVGKKKYCVVDPTTLKILLLSPIPRRPGRPIHSLTFPCRSAFTRMPQTQFWRRLPNNIPHPFLPSAPEYLDLHRQNISNLHLPAQRTKGPTVSTTPLLQTGHLTSTVPVFTSLISSNSQHALHSLARLCPTRDKIRYAPNTPPNAYMA